MSPHRPWTILTIILLLAAGCGLKAGQQATPAAPAAQPTAQPPPSPTPAATELVPQSAAAAPLNRIKLPPGFKIDYFAHDVPEARSLCWAGDGVLFVGSRKRGLVHAVLDRDGDWRAEQVVRIASGLRQPNGVAFRDGALYVAEIGRVLRYDGILERLDNPPQPTVISDWFPEDEHHGWKYIAFGPDGKLYVPVGAPCNICDREEDVYASITRMDVDGSKPEIIARGIRNTVGFDWHPETGELWFTDNGRDWFGDDRPPDELNRLTQDGQHFGFPYFHGNGLVDTEFGRGHRASDFTPPVQSLGPHVAALGMKFCEGSMFPESYRHQILIAEHGSWNRATKIGYRLMLVRLDAQGRSLSYEEFATGWLHNGNVWGRPVDVLEMADGSLLVSDDHAGAVYRISYAG